MWFLRTTSERRPRLSVGNCSPEHKAESTNRSSISWAPLPLSHLLSLLCLLKITKSQNVRELEGLNNIILQGTKQSRVGENETCGFKEMRQESTSMRHTHGQWELECPVRQTEVSAGLISQSFCKFEWSPFFLQSPVVLHKDLCKWLYY